MTKMTTMSICGKVFKRLLWNLKADDFETWYAAWHTLVLPSLLKWYPRLDLDLFYSKIRFGPVCFCIGKSYNNGFFRNCCSLWYKVDRCSQLKWVHEALWVPKARGARWLSGRVSDSGARGPGFETYRRRVVSLSKTLYSPKVLVKYPGSDGSVPTWLKNCWLGR